MQKLQWPSWRDVPPGFWSWPNFMPKELACKGTGKLMIDVQALNSLQDLRRRVGQPMRLTSAYRSPEHNARVGGSPNSKHMLAEAFDVQMAGHDPLEFELLARESGFKGFGFYPASGFMHIDMGPAREWGTRWPASARPTPAPQSAPVAAPEPAPVPTQPGGLAGLLAAILALLRRIFGGKA
jgi:hypothetical protein